MEKGKKRKIIILQDYFLYKGGGERSMIILAKFLGADIATSFVARDAFDPRDEGIKTRELTSEDNWINFPGWRFLKVQFSFFFRTGFLKNYDVIIYSGDCLNAVYRAKGKLNIAYVHTPPRHLFDNYHLRLAEYKGFKKILFFFYALFSRWRYLKAAPKMDFLIANSFNVQERIKKYLGLPSEVVYPPGDGLDFHWQGQEDYYFSYARLYDVKRVDLIVRAFTQMPDKKLVVASGGPELEKIKKIAAGHKNIKILGWISDKQLLSLLGRCVATIYLPINEDFGMSPVESMKAGKPVIGVAEGGLRETIIHQKTGLLLPPDFQIKDICRAVRSLTKEKALAMRKDCEERARLFTAEEFGQRVKKIIQREWEKKFSEKF